MTAAKKRVRSGTRASTSHGVVATSSAEQSGSTWRAYYYLTKPGIVYGNALTAIAGFLFGSLGHFDTVAFLGVVVGTSLIIAAACVYNNIIDRHIDARMQRTSKRALVTGSISVSDAAAYGLILLSLGFLILLLYTNLLTVLIGIIGFIDYVVLYGYFKRKSPIGTLVGSVCGAMPIVAGYCAATGQFDTAALLLFAIMVIWQMPHFYAIAIYRKDDYAEAGLPVLPVAKGNRTAKVHTLIYTVLFLPANILLFTFGYAGYTYLVVMLLASLWWLWWAVRGLSTEDDIKWARKMFGYSLIILLIFSLVLSINYFLP